MFVRTRKGVSVPWRSPFSRYDGGRSSLHFRDDTLGTGTCGPVREVGSFTNDSRMMGIMDGPGEDPQPLRRCSPFWVLRV